VNGRKKDKGGRMKAEEENQEMKVEKNRDLKVRTKVFALRVIHLYSALLKTTEAQVLGK
jgi:hypothetical protein